MSKFNKGDRVQLVNLTGRLGYYQSSIKGDTATIVDVDGHGSWAVKVDRLGLVKFWYEDNFELITRGDKPMARRTFKLIKSTPTMKAGAILQEQCDDGTQPYIMLNVDTHCLESNAAPRIENRALVEDAPKWFVEVFQVEPQFMTQVELDQWEAFKASSKRKVAKTATAGAVAAVKKPGGYKWTPAQRKAQSARIKAYWAAKNAA